MIGSKVTENDIRVGNLIAYDKEIICVTASRISWLDNFKDYAFYEGIPLTPEILEKAGFEGDIWKKKSLGRDMCGPDGTYDLIVAMSNGNQYCAPMIDSSTGDGFTIQEAAAIQKEYSEKHPSEEPIPDNSFCPYKMGNKTVLRPIKYVHELQNLFHALTGTELTINL